MIPDSLNVYGLLMISGIVLTAWVWGRIGEQGKRRDTRLTIIYFCGLFGALIGAKIAFFLAEGWFYRHDWLALLSGRSITGGLLGGYLAVEIAKNRLGYTKVTGDVFAVVVPIGLILGRVGCLIQGCCLGVVCAKHWWTITSVEGLSRWPAAGVELVFNVGFLFWSVLATKRQWSVGNRFHLYMIAYGVFRFGHEFLRDDRLLFGPITGYHLIALVMVVFGVMRFVIRRREPMAKQFIGTVSIR